MARVAFHVLHRCTDPVKNEPLVFSSKMGEINRTQDILEHIAADNGVSPASFSLSVHNAIGGIWSMVHGIDAPMIAVAPHDCSPIPAILEAASLLDEGRYAAVNIIYCEERYPEFYGPYFDGPPSPLALGLRLVHSTEIDREMACQVSLERATPHNRTATWETISELAMLLSGKRTELAFSDPGCGWRLALKT